MSRIGKISFLFIIFLAALFFGAQNTHAASPTFIVSWKSNTSAPPQYEGKIFPVTGSTITVSFELIGSTSTQKGKILDMTNNNVRWYVNGNLISQGNNKKTFSFVTADDNDTETDVRISAEYFDPDVGYSYFVDKYTAIPLSHPQVVVTSVSGGGSVSIGSGTKIRAIPYFFNTAFKNLGIQWLVNGQSVATDPNDPWNLNLNVASNYTPGSSITVSAVVQNVYNPNMTVQKDFILTAQ